jgi:hypothetical protein
MSTDFNEYFAHYIGLVDDTAMLAAIETNHREFLKLVAEIDEEKALFRYAEDKWSIKELIAHIIDSERVFVYRALRFARNDKTDLAGYDENAFAIFSGADERPLTDLVHEFDMTRQSSIAMFKSFDQEMLTRQGTANKIKIDVNSLGYLVAGHCKHHIKIIRERYL